MSQPFLLLNGTLTLLLIVIAHVVFLRRMYHLYRWINLGRGELPWNELPRRFRDVAIKGFAQSLVLRKPSGLGHALIFWGFFALALGTTEALIGGVFHGFSFAFLGPLYAVMNSCQDIFALLILLALAVAFIRRLILRPKRLEGPLSHQLDAYLILSLIALLICGLYGMDILAPKPGFTPVTDTLRAMLLPPHTPLGEEAHPLAYNAFRWLHNLIVLGFLCYIPYSKHLHVITALPNLFWRQERTRGRIPNLNLEDENAEHFGITRITDYTKKELLDLAACTECGRCQEACPAYNTGKPLSPKKVILDLKDHLFHEGPRLLKDPNAAPRHALYPDVITPEVLWACTTCFACEEACPVEIQPMSKLIGIRQARVLMEGDFPEEAQNALRNIETQANPWNLPQSERGKWAEEMGVPTLAENPNVEYLFFVGCAGSYDQRYLRVTRAFAALLQQAKVSFGILGAEETCTGDSAKRIGNEYLAQMMAQQNIETMNGYGVKKIVTACPHCFNSIKNEFPPLGGNFEVIHHTQLLAELIRDGRLKLPSGGASGDGRITYHDSCYLARYNDIAEAPRQIIAAGKGNSLREMPRHGHQSFCCGAGGGRMWMEERIGTNINLERTREALATGASTIATACPFCMTMLTDGIKRENKTDTVAVKDIAEVLAEMVIAPASPRELHGSNT